MTAYHVELESQPAQIQAGEPAELAFTIQNSNGEIAHDLKIVHEQAIHLVVVSEDLSEFYHLHPEQEADGWFRLVYTFPQAGHYRLYADYTPIDAAQIVDQLRLHIAGKERTAITRKWKQLAQAIIDSQQQELDRLRQWKQQWYGEQSSY